MSNDTIENATPAPDAESPKAKRKLSTKTKQARKRAGKKKLTRKAKADCTNKKAEVIAMMKRAKGATLAEIMKETGWQAHTVRGFVSILGKNGEKIESSKSDAGERTYKITK
jgi:hypothetical protein